MDGLCGRGGRSVAVVLSVCGCIVWCKCGRFICLKRDNTTWNSDSGWRFFGCLHLYHSGLLKVFADLFGNYSVVLDSVGSVNFKCSSVTKTSLGLIWNKVVCFSVSEVHATGLNYQNEDEKVTLSFPSTLQKGKSYFHAFCLLQLCV